ncbi:MAG: ATP-binding cassette domain-containing protein [bacterium]
MLFLDAITFQYLGADHPCLNNVSLSLDRDRICILAGDNGSGKTTLGLIACGVIPHLIKGTFVGRVSWNDEVLSESTVGAHSTVVFQNPYTYFQGCSIEDELSLCPPADRAIEDVSGKLLPDVPVDRPLHILSFGQQARVALCSALRQPTPILVLDEPFEALDDTGIALVGEALAVALQSKRLVIVIHRWELPFPSHIAYRTLLVDRGAVRDGTMLGEVAYPSIHDHATGGPVLDVRGLSFSYGGATGFSIRDVSLVVHAGEMLALVGPNGCGKSTLLLVMANLLKRGAGEILLGGHKVEPANLRRLVRCVLQNPDSQTFGTSIREELEFGLRAAGVDPLAIKERVESFRQYLPFDLSSDPFRLSYGQKKLLSLLAAFIVEPSVLLLDEPVAGLDVESTGKFCYLAETFLAQGGGIVMTAHSVAEVETFCSRVLQMSGGVLTGEQRIGPSLRS